MELYLEMRDIQVESNVKISTPTTHHNLTSHSMKHGGNIIANFHLKIIIFKIFISTF